MKVEFQDFLTIAYLLNYWMVSMLTQQGQHGKAQSSY